DIAIHRDDKENPHAHVMLTTREISEEGFTTKNRDWDRKEQLENWREQWSEHANKALEKENIQERITHKSHADRGLEVLPTVHLGHIASAMERKGKETELGNINREVKQYNAIVYDLQKYREEKQQRETLLKEQQKQKAVCFTPKEQEILSAAEKGIGEKPTLENIEKHRKELEEWHKAEKNKHIALNNQYKNISNLYQVNTFVSRFEETLKEKEQALENIGLFKRKEKENLRNEISGLKDTLKIQYENLSTLMKDNGVSTRAEIQTQKDKLESKVNKSLTNYKESEALYKKQKDVLDKSEQAIKDKEIRKVFVLYPDLQGKPIKYETASKLNQIHEQYKVSKFSDIPSVTQKNNSEINTLTTATSNYDERVKKLEQAEKTAKEIMAVHQRIEAIKNNPYQYGKTLNDPRAKEEYENLKVRRNTLTKELIDMGYTTQKSINDDRKMFNEFKPNYEQSLNKIEELKEQNKALNDVQKDIQIAERIQQQKAKTNELDERTR
ncbi:MobA/MobL family protein, partial [Niallia alba]